MKNVERFKYLVSMFIRDKPLRKLEVIWKGLEEQSFVPNPQGSENGDGGKENNF